MDDDIQVLFELSGSSIHVVCQGAGVSDEELDGMMVALEAHMNSIKEYCEKNQEN